MRTGAGSEGRPLADVVVVKNQHDDEVDHDGGARSSVCTRGAAGCCARPSTRVEELELEYNAADAWRSQWRLILVTERRAISAAIVGRQWAMVSNESSAAAG